MVSERKEPTIHICTPTGGGYTAVEPIIRSKSVECHTKTILHQLTLPTE